MFEIRLRRFIVILILMIGSAWAERPNVVLIMADDLGFETIGAYGGVSYKTPVLDELAATGMKFNHCYSQPLCTPSRVQIMTGQYNYRNYTHFAVLPKGEITFGHVMQEAGYATGIAGKWQLWGANTEAAQAEGLGQMPDEAGFDDYLLWQITRRKKFGERYADPLVESKEKGLHSLEGAYGPEVYTDFILDFMESHVDDPFFVYYPMALTHDPFVPTPDGEGWDGDRYAKDNARFADMVAYMDKTIGRIVAKLDELGVRENTVLLFVGDNGTHPDIGSLMNDGRVIQGNKGKPDDGGTHVPMIANWPGVIEAGRVSDDLIDFSDFLPTIASLAEAKLPTDRMIDGQSFEAQLRGEVGKPRDWILCDYNPRWGGREPSRFARNQRWKLYGDGRFIDVQHDRLEQEPIVREDLANDEQATWDMLQGVLDEHKN